MSPAMARRLPCVGGQVLDAQTGLVTAEVSCRGRISSVFLPIGALVTVEVTGQSLKDDP